ncbi:MAG: hypothetical protein VB119_01955 [Candidatus Metalachnospira sp.]|nr:hypothetical protein [Candidatus Metalachnospira sp.]
MNTRKKVSFPNFNHYDYVFKYFVENALDADYIMPPAMTVRTLERGTKCSPDFICAPFKSTLGSMMDCLEAGADTLIMSMGLCRLGYYGELQEQILRDLGYQFDFVNLSEYNTGSAKDYLKALKRINPKLSLAKLTKVVAESIKLIEHLDEAESIYYKNCGFEVTPGSYKKARKNFLTSIETASSGIDIAVAYKTLKKEYNDIPLKKPENPLKVGIIGEYFTVMDPFSNLDLEQKLADMGVEVHRFMNITNRNLHYKTKNLEVETSEYCKYEMGPTSTANIWCAKNYASHGFDGIVHAKSVGCTPEIDIMPVLQNISEDYKVPILYLTYDSQTSDTGLATRLEAFYDMISMRKKVF